MRAAAGGKEKFKKILKERGLADLQTIVTATISCSHYLWEVRLSNGI